jgi:hypothetical protein
LEFMDGDPVVKRGLMTAKLLFFGVSLVGTARTKQGARMRQVMIVRWMKPDGGRRPSSGAWLRPEDRGEGR